MDAISKVYLHKLLKENLAMDHFMTSTFWAIDYTKPA